MGVSHLRERLTGQWSLFRRRDLFTFLGAAALARPAANEASALRIGPNIFESIGVKPLINAKGTFTIVTGSLSLPEVKQAMLEASKHYVHLDELMEAVGRRLAALTGAEWGIVTNGCAAALTHATAACIAGTDPEKLQRLPMLAGLKNQVVAPRHSRNVYDHAIRMLGVEVVTVETEEELQRALTPRVALAMVLAGPAADREPLSTQSVSRICHERGVPVLVDAAAEILTIPNKHLQAGADLVAYSGGKCLRGPQSAGLLLGRRDLVQAAWLHSAPHHAFGRPMKCGKEEIMGMLAAVEMWVKRDYKAEMKVWEGWLEKIASQVQTIPGVTTEIRQPVSLSNHSATLIVRWDGEKLGITGREVERHLYTTEPRIVLAGATGDRRTGGPSSVTIMPYMMEPNDHLVVARRLREVLNNPPRIDSKPKSAEPPVNVDGQWDVQLRFSLGEARHRLVFEQNGEELVGTHVGETIAGDLRGLVNGSEVWFRSRQRYEGTTLEFEFTGQLSSGRLAGTVSMGEYGTAEWTAERRRYGRA
jgi:L-seryl-tRNA(Ser) seleniumtransferase